MQGTHIKVTHTTLLFSVAIGLAWSRYSITSYLHYLFC